MNQKRSETSDPDFDIIYKSGYESLVQIYRLQGYIDTEPDSENKIDRLKRLVQLYANDATNISGYKAAINQLQGMGVNIKIDDDSVAVKEKYNRLTNDLHSEVLNADSYYQGMIAQHTILINRLLSEGRVSDVKHMLLKTAHLVKRQSDEANIEFVVAVLKAGYLSSSVADTTQGVARRYLGLTCPTENSLDMLISGLAAFETFEWKRAFLKLSTLSIESLPVSVLKVFSKHDIIKYILISALVGATRGDVHELLFSGLLTEHREENYVIDELAKCLEDLESCRFKELMLRADSLRNYFKTDPLVLVAFDPFRTSLLMRSLTLLVSPIKRMSFNDIAAVFKVNNIEQIMADLISRGDLPDHRIDMQNSCIESNILDEVELAREKIQAAECAAIWQQYSLVFSKAETSSS